LGNRDIAERLFVSEATVKTHVQRILRKLDADSRTHAVSRAHELMLL
jgi:DNA-binding NarL/FixJ family response regulator